MDRDTKIALALLAILAAVVMTCGIGALVVTTAVGKFQAKSQPKTGPTVAAVAKPTLDTRATSELAADMKQQTKGTTWDGLIVSAEAYRLGSSLDVTLKTKLYPKDSNETDAFGMCHSVIGMEYAGAKVESVKVLASDSRWLAGTRGGRCVKRGDSW